MSRENRSEIFVDKKIRIMDLKVQYLLKKLIYIF